MSHPLPPRVLLLFLAAACSRGTTEPPVPGLQAAASGNLERGTAVRFTVTRAGAQVPAGEWQVSATPADAISFLGGDSARLNRSGEVVLTFRAGESHGSLSLTVVAPPVVVFERLLDANRDIWRIDLDGQGLARVTSDPAADQDPTVAAGRVVFVSYRSGNAELWSMPLGGGAATRLTSTARSELTPSLSPDGQRLAYSHDPDGLSKLWTANADGSGAARATGEYGLGTAIEASPHWGPGGNRLVFMSTAGGSADVYELTLGAQPTPLASSSSAEVEPAWSPDGRMVAFVSTRSGQGADLYLVHLSTGEVTRLTTGSQTEGQPAWAPDSRRIVFTDFGGGTRRLHWVDVTQPGVTHLIPTGEGRAENAAVTAPTP